MANEFSFTVAASDSKYSPPISFNSSKLVSQSGSDALEGIQNVGTSWTALNIGSIGTVGYLAIENKDTTNYVQVAIANDGSGIFARLKAGDPPLLLPVETGATYYVKANSSACDISRWIVEA